LRKAVQQKKEGLLQERSKVGSALQPVGSSKVEPARLQRQTCLVALVLLPLVQVSWVPSSVLLEVPVREAPV
jgi:hypothetical protein